MLVLDTNAIADLIFGLKPTLAKVAEHKVDDLLLVAPVDYEVLRGLRHRSATSKISIYRRITAQFTHVPVLKTDWDRAASLWAKMRQQGRQFSDIDLLIAAMCQRLAATLVTSDADFQVLEIRQVNWRE